MKLVTLKSPLQVARGKLQGMPAHRPGTVERKRGSAGVRDRNKIRARDCGVCQACAAEGRLGVPGAAVDHKVPLWAGGTDEPGNKWLLCEPCHEAKSKREAAQRASGCYTPE